VHVVITIIYQARIFWLEAKAKFLPPPPTAGAFFFLSFPFFSGTFQQENKKGLQNG